AYVNRLYSLPVPDKKLDQFRKLHDMAMFVVPLLLFVSLVQISRGENENAAAIIVLTKLGWWTLPWALVLFGFGGLVLTILTRLLRVRPPAFELVTREIIDVEQELGYRPQGEGPYQRLLKVPGNQAFTFELSEKKFTFSKLHDDLHELTILHLSDLHFIGTIDRPYFEMLCEKAAKWNPDLVVFTGDLIDRQELTSWLPTTLGKLSAPLGCHYILGNHDWHLDCELIRQQMQELGWQDCAGTVTEVNHRQGTIHIGGDERPWMGKAPQFKQDDNAFKLLLSHTPDNFPWAKKQGIDLMLSGHNHGGQVVLPLIGPLYSPSRYGVRYAGGEFYSSGTTMHVSRGVSGKHPLRINCRPEVTLIHLLKRAETVKMTKAERLSEIALAPAG
ncbi:MAG: metallophosphoesterase, partial [Planctomycetaceae bacterium]|nr:metallophosphoesterase [Planctomycetaceae bacterium]